MKRNKQTYITYKTHNKLKFTRLTLPIILLIASIMKNYDIKFDVKVYDPHSLTQQLSKYCLSSMNHHPVDFLFTRNVEHYSMKDSIANDLKCNYGNKLKTVEKDEKNDLNKNYNINKTNKNEENLQNLGDKISKKRRMMI